MSEAGMFKSSQKIRILVREEQADACASAQIETMLTILILGLLFSCTTPKKKENKLDAQAVDSAGRKTVENSLTENASGSADGTGEIVRSKIINPAFSTEYLFGVWTTDPDGPHADFTLDSNSFYIVDYDGNGHRPYVIWEDSLIIFYGDFTGRNKILKADKDSLILESEDGVVKHVRWKE